MTADATLVWAGFEPATTPCKSQAQATRACYVILIECIMLQYFVYNPYLYIYIRERIWQECIMPLCISIAPRPQALPLCTGRREICWIWYWLKYYIVDLLAGLLCGWMVGWLGIVDKVMFASRALVWYTGSTSTLCYMDLIRKAQWAGVHYVYVMNIIYFNTINTDT